jgi:hypothetical protein
LAVKKIADLVDGKAEKHVNAAGSLSIEKRSHDAPPLAATEDKMPDK